MRKRKYSLNEEFFNKLYQCTSCGACNEVCHLNIHLSEMWELVKEYMIANGMEPLAKHKVLYERISDPKRRNPFYDDADPEKDSLANRAAWLPEDIKLSDNPEVLFFAGCTSSYRLKNLSKNTVKILAKANIELTNA